MNPMDALRNPQRTQRLLRLLTKAAAATLLLLGLVALTACDTLDAVLTDTDDAEPAAPSPVQIGSKDFTENLILGELYALALEDFDIPVQRRLGLASAVVHVAMLQGDIDLYPEYTGTGLLTVLQLPMETDPQTVFDIVSKEYYSRYDIVWLDAAPANNSQGIVVTAEASETYNITTISDFQREAHNLRFATQGEFDYREDALPLLIEVYGSISFKSSALFDNALKYEILESGQADAAPAYTTEGRLTDPAFVLLEDDKQAWPPYNIAPIIRSETLVAHPEIALILNAISVDLTSEMMTALNAQVDVDGQDYAEVALEYWLLIRDVIIEQVEQAQ